MDTRHSHYVRALPGHTKGAQDPLSDRPGLPASEVTPSLP